MDENDSRIWYMITVIFIEKFPVSDEIIITLEYIR